MMGGGVGTTWVFTFDGASWDAGVELVGLGAVGNAEQGTSVSLSSDGTVLAVGGPKDNTNNGTVWVFVFNGVSWDAGTKLAGFDIGSAPSGQGFSVSLSSDGTVLAAGAPDDDSNIGAVWIFTYNGASWDAGTKLVGSGSIGISRQGTSVNLSSNGTELVVGAPDDNSNTGAVWMFTYNDSSWDTGTKFVGGGVSSESRQGTSVSFSGDGNSLMIGGPGGDDDMGRVWWYVLSGSFSEQFLFTIPSRTYTIFDLTETLNNLLIVDDQTAIVSTFNGLDINTLTMSTSSNVVAVFIVDSSSTFDLIRWISTEYDNVQVSSPIDMTINNNIIRTIASHSINANNLITSLDKSQIFRKYEAGFTIEDADLIDIQLRDERDRIVDLGGLDWIMTVFVTIHF